MASTLFGYSIEEDDGKLVITVHGTFAETAARQLREELSQGRGVSLIQRLSPLGPLGYLVSRGSAEKAAATGDQADLMDLEETGRALASDEILNQGVDQSLRAFELEMARFRAALDQAKNELRDPAEDSGATT